MTVTGAWTPYGRQQMLAVATGVIPAPTLYVALFDGTADPAAPPVECTLAGYGRQQTAWLQYAIDTVATSGALAFGPLAAGAYRGLGVFDDDAAGGCWWWADQSSTLTIPGGSYVNFAAGDLQSQVT